MRFNTCPGADTLRRVQPWQSRPSYPTHFGKLPYTKPGTSS